MTLNSLSSLAFLSVILKVAAVRVMICPAAKNECISPSGRMNQIEGATLAINLPESVSHEPYLVGPTALLVTLSVSQAGLCEAKRGTTCTLNPNWTGDTAKMSTPTTATKRRRKTSTYVSAFITSTTSVSSP